MGDMLKKRCEIEEKYKWNLAHIYPNEEAWENAFEEASRQIAGFAAYAGHVKENTASGHPGKPQPFPVSHRGRG